jgi:hypothetical protein
MKRPLLVVGGKLPEEALRWLAEVERHFPGTCDDIVIIRNPFSSIARRREKGITQETREEAIGNVRRA